MKKHDHLFSKSILSFCFAVLLFFVAKPLVTAQCPPISVVASASPSIVCNGNTSQLNVTAGVTGGGYTVSQINYNPIAGSGTMVTLGDDVLSTMLPIGFNFTFFGNVYSQFNICSNGFISFLAANSQTFTPSAISNVSLPNNMVCGSWADLNPNNGGTVSYFTTGFAPNRKLVVRFDSVMHFTGGNPITMEYVLCETTNFIELHNTSVIATNTNHVQGIEDANGLNGLPVPGRNNTTWTSINEGWRFSPGIINLNYSWSTSGSLTNPTSVNPVASPSVSTLYTVIVTDINGCTDSTSVSVIVNNPPTSITANPSTICAGSNSQLTASVTTTSTNNYAVTPITYSPVITGIGTPVILGDDQVSSPLPIGFNFSFYTHYYSHFFIGSNGFITFDSAASTNNYQGCCSGQMLPNAANPNNLIAGAWEDLNVPAGGGVNYFVTGTFPNRKLVVNFNSIPHSPARDSLTFQIILFETTNIIEIHTADMPGNSHGYWWGHTQGIENANGTLGLAVPGRNHDNTWTATNDGWRFSPINTFTYNWNPVASLSNDTIYNPLASPSATITYTLLATDGNGCMGTGNVTVNVNPLPSPPVISYPGFVLYSTYGTGNQWYLNGNILTGAIYQTYYPTQIGIYTVTYTDGNGCTSTSEPFNVTILGVNELGMDINVNVFPNPVTDLLTVNVDNNLPSEIVLYDITSRIVFQQKFSSALSVSTETLAKGIYLYEIRNKNEVVKKGKLEKE